MINVSIEEYDGDYENLFDASYFFLLHLFKDPIDLRVDIIFDDLGDSGNFTGLIEKIHGHHYEIYIHDGLSYSLTLITLAHELTHVKQYFFQELLEHSNGDVTWKGKHYNHLSFHEFIPWEEEAFRMELDLYYRWLFLYK